MINVTEYKRKQKKGSTLCFSYYVGGKRYQETTGLVLLNGKDAITRQLNKETRIRFDELKLRKVNELMDGIIVPQAVKRQRMDFFKYFEEYMLLFPSKERRNISTLKKIKAFWGKDTLPVSEVTETMLRKFKIYLETGGLTGETPYDYFKALKKVLKQATKERLFAVNPATDIVLSKQSNAPKAILTTEEIARLEAAECGNENVKRAFLFSCYTGIRFCDIKVLKWSNITTDNRAKITQVKTMHPLDQLLIPEALELIGTRGDNDQLVLPLPTWNGTNKNIKRWMEKAGIEKKITYHCSRHTFATEIYIANQDLYMSSLALGHKGLGDTIRYVHHSKEMLDNALLNLSKKRA